jgi:para-aminobenzoate synthetase / 4-amino-4-deoxychorismate lyase
MLSIHSAADFLHLLQTCNQLVLLESTLAEQGDGWNYLFVDPVHTLQIHRVSEFFPLLESMQRYVQEGYYLAGYFAYECGYFIEKLGRLDYVDEQNPLAWFGVYRTPYRLAASLRSVGWQALAATLKDEARIEIQDLRFDLDEETYRQKVECVREHIRAGDVYQINLTGRYHFRVEGTPLALYARLRQTQRTPYSAYLRIGRQDILCCSPELFFRLDGQSISARPMKGTAPRGRTMVEDEWHAAWLQADGKNRAENIMITDLLRNDLGRICAPGSVRVPHLLSIEPYDTVLQMTSTITGTLARGVDYTQIFPGLFPCGSITGAPKIKAMEIINQLETTPRGIYTGAIGYLAPQTAHEPGHALFNVAIRTIVLEQGHGTMGIGSGIIHDSNAAEEAAECRIKARFLTVQALEFDIIEAILWDGDYRRLEQHLMRMAASARYFGYPWDRTRIHEELSRQSEHMSPGRSYKVRLLLKRGGELACESILIQRPGEEEPVVILSNKQIASQDRMYFHKTTYRPLYKRALRFAQEHGYADVLFCNEKGEVTEGAVSNIFIERTGRLLTPPVHCGLLPGIYRQYLLEEHPQAQEAVLCLNDLLTAEKVYLCNAIRGLRQVKVVTTPQFEFVRETK